MPEPRKARHLEYFHPEPPKRPTPPDASGTGWITLVVGTLFMIPVLLLFWSHAVPYLAQPVRALGWKQVPCTVLSADTKQVQVKGGTTMDLDLKYTYQFQGITHMGTRYSFGHPLGETQTRQRLRELAPQTTLTCLVNPADPTEAVIDPHLSQRAWAVVLLLPFSLLPYLAIYVGIMRIRYTRHKRRLGAAADSRSSVAEVLLLPIIPLTLLAALMLYIDIAACAGVLAWLLTILVAFTDSLLIALMTTYTVWDKRRNRRLPPASPSPTSG